MYRSLEKIYSQQVRGNVAPRRHLRVLGEAVEEETAPDINSLKAEIQQAVDNLSFDDTKEAQYLLKQIYNFPTYKNIKKSLGSKGYSPLVYKKFSNDVQQLLVDIGPEFRDDFLAYLRDNDSQIDFPTTEREGMNIFTVIGDKVDHDLVTAIMKHTGSDEGGRGVGMGELALALIFKNLSAGGKKRRENVETAEVKLKKLKEKHAGLKRGDRNKLTYSDTAIKARIKEGGANNDLDKAFQEVRIAKQVKAKGDLEIEGKEFEIKGQGATLGERPDKISDEHVSDTVNSLANMGEVAGVKFFEKGEGYQVGPDPDDWVSGLNNLPIAISKAYEMIPVNKNGVPDKEKQKKFEDIFKKFLKVSGEHKHTDKYYNKGINFDLSNPASIQNGISLLNFIGYAELEGFTRFMAHDFGTKGNNEGEYVYVKGKPLDMAKKLLASPARFEKVSRSNLRPRIGFGDNYAGMTPTSVNVDPAQEIKDVGDEEEEIEYY